MSFFHWFGKSFFRDPGRTAHRVRASGNRGPKSRLVSLYFTLTTSAMGLVIFGWWTLQPTKVAKKTLRARYRGEEPMFSRYVSRPALEGRLQRMLSKSNEKRVIVIYGDPGSGKTTLWNHVLSGRPGVIRVGLTGQESRDEIYEILCHELSRSNRQTDDFENFVHKEFARFAGRGREQPVIVFEIQKDKFTTSGDGDRIQISEFFGSNISLISRVMADYSCTSIVDVPMMMLTSEPFRYFLERMSADSKGTFIHVPPFGEAEAYAMLEGREVTLDGVGTVCFSQKNYNHINAVKEQILDIIGTNPGTLERVLGSDSVAEEVAAITKHARWCVRNVVRSVAEDADRRGMLESLRDLPRDVDQRGQASLVELSQRFGVFQVDPIESRVDLRSVAMRRAVERYLNMPSTQWKRHFKSDEEWSPQVEEESPQRTASFERRFPSLTAAFEESERIRESNDNDGDAH